MLLTLFLVTISILLAIIPLWSMRVGLVLYLVGALIFPSLWFGEVALRFELFYCLWLVLVFFMRKYSSGFTFKWHSILSKYGLYLVVVVLSTLLAMPREAAEWSLMQLLISLYGTVRPFLIMFLFINVLADEDFVRRIIWAFVWLSIPIALLSMGQTLGLDIAQEVTLLGYTSPWRTPVFALLREHGRIVRSTGVFESPVPNATYFLMVLTTAGFLLVRGRHKTFYKWSLYLIFGLALMAGITTLSSTFLLGFIVVLGLFVVFLWPRYNWRFLRIAVRSVCIAGLFIFLFLPYLSKQPLFSGVLNYQFQRILSGNVLETRYDPETGNLAKTYKAIAQKPVLGWGLTQLGDVFVGDSLYVTTLYRGGILGLLLYLWAIWSILQHTWRFSKTAGLSGDLNTLCFLWTLLSLATSVGAGGGFATVRLQEWYWGVVGMSLNPFFLMKSQSQSVKGAN